jgi:hypothetical protein
MISSAVVDEPGSRRTLACSVARLTLAASTPGIRLSAFSTLATQEAQVIPSISRVKIEEFVSFCRLIWKIIYLIAGEFTS